MPRSGRPSVSLIETGAFHADGFRPTVVTDIMRLVHDRMAQVLPHWDESVPG